jgi:carboxymethylenebutenolidase
LVLVIQEIFGVHPHIQDVCRRFAAEGYVAIAPELYFRQGDVSQMTDHDRIRGLAAQVPDSQVMSDLDAVIDFAVASGDADPGRVALTGFCWGGRITWLYAAHSERLRAATAFYGKVEQKPTPLQPRNPIDFSLLIKCPVLGLYAAKDAGIPVEGVMRMVAIAPRAEINVYPEVGHGFFADYRPSYNAAAAQDAWRRTLAFFRKHGV